MINAWQWEKLKAIAFPACKCKSRLNFRVWGQFEIKILKVQLMNTTYFICSLKKLELEPAVICKVATCQRILSKKHSNWQWVDTWAHDTVRWCRSAETLFWQLSINQNMDAQYQVADSQTSLTWDQALFFLFFASLLLWLEREKNNAWYIYLTSRQPPPNLHNLTSAWPVMLLANKRLP